MLRDVDMTACLDNLFQQWIVSEKKECWTSGVCQFYKNVSDHEKIW